MRDTIKPVQCKCGSQAEGPKWVSRVRGYTVKCTKSDCRAMSQAKTKANAVEVWNRTATKL